MNDPFWAHDRERAGCVEWLKISLVRIPHGSSGVYHVAVLDDFTSEVISQRDYADLDEAIVAFEGLCTARELLFGEVD